jgi:hypothetical protein
MARWDNTCSAAVSFGVGTALMDERTVQDFRQSHACGDALIGGLRERFGGDYERFFSDYHQFRFSLERHPPACSDAKVTLSDWAAASYGLCYIIQTHRLYA